MLSFLLNLMAFKFIPAMPPTLQLSEQSLYLFDFNMAAFMLLIGYIWLKWPDENKTKNISLLMTLCINLLWIYNLKNFNFYSYDYQFVNFVLVNDFATLWFGVDHISYSLILLTTLMMPLCIYGTSGITKNLQGFIMSLLFIELFLILSFFTMSLFYFYVFFESVLIPMFVLIGYWGSRDRKMKAAYYFFLYTLVGSLFLLFGILYIITITGTDMNDNLQNVTFKLHQHLLLFILFFIPFSIKIPMLPFHIWLPEAHVEAPTMGSIILASLLLKLGGYGLIRYTLPLFWFGTEYFTPLVDTLAIMSVIYASFTTIRQTDLKRIMAYSSVAHMNLVVLGMFSLNSQGVAGAMYMMVGHGFVSSALFFSIGCLYDRYHTRLLKYYSGLVVVMPLFSIYMFVFTMANMSFPGTCNFIAELVILTGIFGRNPHLAVFAGTGIVLSAIYSMWLFNSLCFGTLKTQFMSSYVDLTMDETIILSYFSFLTMMFGLNSHSILFEWGSFMFLN